MSNTNTYTARYLGKVENVVLEHFSSVLPLKTEWETLQKMGTGCIYQNYDWVRIATETFEKNNETFIITGRINGDIKFILPLVLEKNGWIKILRWAGKNHANICSGLFTPDFLASISSDMPRKIINEIGNKIPGIVIAWLDHQLPELNGLPNPFLNLPHQTSINPMYDLNLTGGITNVLALGNGRRKRKIFRNQVKVAGEHGGYELYIPKTREEIQTSIEDFRRQKARRFKDLGVQDVFSEHNAIEFIEALAHEPMKDGIQLFRIFELRIGGKTRAMYGAAIFGNYCQACVNSVTYDELAHISPGEMVLYLMIEHLADNGFTKLDFGVGDERYKRSWCKTHHDLFDNILPLSKRAIPFIVFLKLKQKLKTYIRRNDKIWQNIKKLRSTVGKITG